MKKERPVLIKGIRGGLKIYLREDAELPQILTDLEQRIEANRQFFEGAKVNLVFSGKTMSLHDKQELLRFVSKEILVGTVEFKTEDEETPSVDFFETFDGIEEGITRFIRGTIRSGQRIYYEGNVVVIGDVNPGGEVIAGGNILVFGVLRGLAHAGATGNGQAIVAAFHLQPTQLRIGGLITRPPEGETLSPSYPELACIRDGQLVIEPYLPGKLRRDIRDTMEA